MGSTQPDYGEDTDMLREFFANLFSESDSDKEGKRKAKKPVVRKRLPKRQRMQMMGVQFHDTDEELNTPTHTTNVGVGTGIIPKVISHSVKPYTPVSVPASDSDVTITSVERLPLRETRGRMNRMRLCKDPKQKPTALSHSEKEKVPKSGCKPSDTKTTAKPHLPSATFPRIQPSLITPNDEMLEVGRALLSAAKELREALGEVSRDLRGM